MPINQPMTVLVKNRGLGKVVDVEIVHHPDLDFTHVVVSVWVGNQLVKVDLKDVEYVPKQLEGKGVVALA